MFEDFFFKNENNSKILFKSKFNLKYYKLAKYIYNYLYIKNSVVLVLEFQIKSLLIKYKI